MEKENIETSDYEIGLSKVLGRKIKEIHGYTSSEFDEPTFKLTKVEFEDGTFLGCEGEHDFPYLVHWGIKGNAMYMSDYSEKIDETYELTKDED